MNLTTWLVWSMVHKAYSEQCQQWCVEQKHVRAGLEGTLEGVAVTRYCWWFSIYHRPSTNKHHLNDKIIIWPLKKKRRRWAWRAFRKLTYMLWQPTMRSQTTISTQTWKKNCKLCVHLETANISNHYIFVYHSRPWRKCALWCNDG